MGIPLKVLIVEDSDDDAAMLLHELRRGGYDPVYTRIETADEMKSSLAEDTWEIVIADYSMPRFSSAAALKAVQEFGLDVPFIILSGVIGEDAAVDAMKAGAQDYVFKGNMARLIPAIQRELREAAMRREHRGLEAANKHILKSQDELVRMEKLAAIGQLSGGLAHDLRTPLGAILNSVYTLNKWLEANPKIASNDKIARCVNTIRTQVTRANNVITDMLEFARVNSPALRPVSMHDLIDESLATIEGLRNIEIVKNYKRGMPKVMADGDMLSRVFINLITNANEAMSSGGRLTISTRSVDGYAVIEFEDTGTGISQKDLAKIFDPLFTTKMRGTGLGLAVCHQIMAKHGGSINVSSIPDRGTTFTLRLPLEGTVSYQLVPMEEAE